MISARRAVSGAWVILALAGAAAAAGLGAGATAYGATSAAATTKATVKPACPAGLTETRLMTPSATPLATARPRLAGTVRSLPGGQTVRVACLGPQPTPFQAPALVPEHVVGGPRLAETGVVTDLPAGVPVPPDMPHVSYVLADLDTGEILAAKNAHAWLRPASTLKALTALTVIPRLDPGTVVFGAAEDTLADGTRVGITVGGRYTVDDLLNGLLLGSGNDAAYALGRAFGGRSTLIAAMNTEAARLGAWDTVAVDPSGLDAEGQRTSAFDLALIGRAAMGLAEYRRRAALPVATFPGGLVLRSASPSTAAAKRSTGSGASATLVPGAPYQIQNHNQLLDVYPGVIGVKNGYTSLAQGTYIGAVRYNGRALIVAEMGSPEAQVHSTPALLDWGFTYAAQARPVGHLVAPGSAAQPPELGGPAVTSSASPTLSTSATMSDPAAWQGANEPVPAPSSSPTAFEVALAAGVSSWWAGLPDGGRWGLLGGLAVAVLGLGALLRRLSGRRLSGRPRGTYQP
ncbi:MAG: serine hydrolase [Candidatus Phosphoribacter sp.]|nr:D-alanyl-D-alanine carboxypeptidase [Actinomycetales bacterium]